MKILRIYTKLPPLKGGMEKHIYTLSKWQISNAHKVKIFFNDGDALSNNDKKICNLKLHKIKPQLIGILIFYILIIIQLIQKKEKFDILHIHGDWSSLLLVKILKKLTKSKITVFSIHDQLSNKFTHKKLLPKLLKNIDLIFSTGYDSAIQLKKTSDKQVVIQPSGINETFFEQFNKKFTKNRFSVVTVANLFPKKNITFILDIAKILKDFTFVIVGDGIQKLSLKEKIKNENIYNVQLVGFKTTEEVKLYYQNSNCYLLTSFAEGTPTSALEAMACGLPIVSSNAGGLSNIVKDGINGFIINDFNKNNYIDKLNLIKNNLELQKKIYNSNIELAKNYIWENVAKNITNKIEETLNEKN